MARVQYSKSQVDKAGRLIRKWVTDRSGTFPEYRDALLVLNDFRAQHQLPLTKATVGLRSMVSSEGHEILVTQRLKRTPQLIRKLARFPGMRLTQVEDIGGCRAVLPNAAAVSGVLRRIRRYWDIIDVNDYVAAPKSTGYRGVHVMVWRDDVRLEAQLRTPFQQEWADAVEGWAGRLREPLKDGRGPDEVLEWLRVAADMMALDEAGERIDDALEARFLAAQRGMRDYLDRVDGDRG